MKRSRYQYLQLVLAALTMISFYSCKKDYLTDGGLAKSNTPYNTYDYLRNNATHQFDSVIMIIDHFGLKDSVNNAGTFFVPTDYSINRFMNTAQMASMDSLYAHISSKFLTQFMFSDTAITLNKVTTSVRLYQNWADTVSGVKKTAFTYGAANSAFTYYILQYVQINGALDGSSGAPASDPPDGVLNCQTTGIKTSSGTNLNVLTNTADIKGR